MIMGPCILFNSSITYQNSERTPLFFQFTYFFAFLLKCLIKNICQLKSSKNAIIGCAASLQQSQNWSSKVAFLYEIRPTLRPVKQTSDKVHKIMFSRQIVNFTIRKNMENQVICNVHDKPFFLHNKPRNLVLWKT